MTGYRSARPLDGLGVGLNLEFQDSADVIASGDKITAVLGHRTFLF
jgi:hypothetical protein